MLESSRKMYKTLSRLGVVPTNTTWITVQYYSIHLNTKIYTSTIISSVISSL